MFSYVSSDLKMVGLFQNLKNIYSKEFQNIFLSSKHKTYSENYFKGVEEENLFGFDLKSSFRKVKHFKIHKKMNHRIKSSDSS